MVIEDLKTSGPVLAAVREWDRTGDKAFRSKHGSGVARRYFLVVGKQRYDLKPIMAAALNLAFPKTQLVKSRDFHTRRARAVAEGLGFEVFVSAIAAQVEAERRTISEAARFDPKSKADGRTRILSDIVHRQGQAHFRRTVLAAYAGRCAISGCNVQQVLDAAHIVPYRGPMTNHVANGILLRADLHNLFDLLLITVNPQSMKVEVSPKLRDSAYWRFHGRKLGVSKRKALHPSRVALGEHRREAEAV